MPIVILQHAPSEHVGRLGVVLRDLGFRLDVRRLDLWGGAGGKGPGGVPGDLDGVDGVISLGGPMNVGDSLAWMRPELDFLRAAHERALPLIGVCLGHQLIAAALGGEVGPAAKPEVGFVPTAQTVAGHTDTVLSGLAWAWSPMQVHAQEVKRLPEGATALISSSDCAVQCFRAGLRTYGFQFHFEWDKTDIAALAGDPDVQRLMQGAGVGVGDLRAQLDARYEEYQRLSGRLCENLATYLFPVLKRLR